MVAPGNLPVLGNSISTSKSRVFSDRFNEYGEHRLNKSLTAIASWRAILPVARNGSFFRQVSFCTFHIIRSLRHGSRMSKRDLSLRSRGQCGCVTIVPNVLCLSFR
jgi:hypothetical protein